MGLPRYTGVLATILLTFVIATSPFVAAQPVSNAFALPGASYYSCWFWGLEFNASGNQAFEIRWNSTGPTPTALDIYVTPTAPINPIWYCDSGPEGAFYDSGAYGSVAWTAPATSEYLLLVANAHFNPVTGTLSISAGNATIRAVVVGYSMAWWEPYCPPSCQQY